MFRDTVITKLCSLIYFLLYRKELQDRSEEEDIIGIYPKTSALPTLEIGADAPTTGIALRIFVETLVVCGLFPCLQCL